MSLFVTRLANIEEPILVNNENYLDTLDNLMNEMLLIENSIHNIANTYIKNINEVEINNILNESTNKINLSNLIGTEKINLGNKLKDTWAKIVAWFFEIFDSIYNFIYERIFINKKFIDSHINEIMNNKLVYGEYDKTKNNENIVYIDQIEVKLNINIIDGKLPFPRTSKSDLDKYLNSDGKIDIDGITMEYTSELLGRPTKVSINALNQKETKLKMKANFDRAISILSDIKIRKRDLVKRVNTSKELTLEEVKEFQNLAMNRIQSYRIYYKILLDYTREILKIFKMFVKSPIKKGVTTK